MLEEFAEFKRTIAATLRVLTRTKHLYVVFQGKQAVTNGSLITLPNVDVLMARPITTEDELKKAHAYILALRGYAYHEAAHITDTDLDVFERVGRKYGSFAHSWLNLFEDIRCEHRFGARAPHIRDSLEFVRERYVWGKIARKTKRKLFHKRDLVSEFAFAMQVLLKHGKAAHDHKLWLATSDEAKRTARRFSAILRELRATFALPRETGTEAVEQQVLAMFGQMRDEHASVQRLWPVALGEAAPDTFLVTLVDDIPKYLKSITHANVAKTAKFQVFSVTASDVAKWPRFAGKPVAYVESMPGAKAGIRPAVDVPDGCFRTIVVKPPDEAAAQQMLAVLINVAGTVVRQAVSDDAAEAFAVAKVEIERLPYDGKPYLVYTTANDLFPDTKPATPLQAARLEEEARTLYGPIARRLSVLLRSRVRSRWRGNQEEGERLDLSNLYQVAIAQRTNVELRPFMVHVPKDSLLATVVGVLVDTSGSMDGTRIDLARQTGFCIGSALSQAKIDFAMWGFTSRNTWRQPYSQCPEDERDLYARFGGLHVETVKSLAMRWEEARQRIPSLGETMVANYDADSLRHCARELLRARAKRRVMFVLSDGQPASGEPHTQTGRQQHELRQVVEQARAAGVEIVGIGIQSECVLEFYKPMAVVVHTLTDLPKVVLSEMEWLLLGTHRKRA